MANTYLSRTPSGAGNKQKFTFSVWIKKLYQATGTNRRIVSSYFSNGGRHAFLAFGTDEQLYAFSGNYTSGGSTTDSYRLNSSRKFRDTNAWYHIVYRVDTTQSTASDRIRCYVNGELLAWDTSHSDHLYPSQSDENYLNSDYPIQINALNTGDLRILFDPELIFNFSEYFSFSVKSKTRYHSTPYLSSLLLNDTRIKTGLNFIF